MGLCNSCGQTTEATAKLILEDGRLKEFSYPIRVSLILQRNPTCFICNADDLGFDDVVSAIDDQERLELGQLYFELPLSWLDNPIKAQDMAALAVKASLALKMGGGRDWWCCWFGLRRLDMDHIVELLNSKKAVEARPLVTINLRVHGGGGGGGGSSGGGGGGGGSGRGRKFANDLSIILEE